MITNQKATGNPNEGFDSEKLIGVGSINVLAVNPNNAKLRFYGWNIPETQEEPKYVVVDNDGRKSARIRFLVQVQDIKEKPVVAMDFWVRPEVSLNKDNTKCKIIDEYGRTAWGTKDEIKEHKVPEYPNGPANISKNYKLCHIGEEELVNFLMKYLNVTPLQVYKDNAWVTSSDPGKLTIDNWQAICDGNVKELIEYVSLMPDNKVKVAFGIRTSEDNKSYQTFLNTRYFSNWSKVDSSGEYAQAKKAIEKFYQDRPSAPVTFSAAPVKRWSVQATEVKENTDMPEEFSEPTLTGIKDDLPWED